jgi:hypothetical protein
MDGPYFFKVGLPGIHGNYSFTVTGDDLIHEGGKPVNPESVVSVSASQRGGDGDDYNGSADITVMNVAPRKNGNIEIRLNVNWSENLAIHVRGVYWNP